MTRESDHLIIPVPDARRMLFVYTNWRGKAYVYDVQPESLEYQLTGPAGHGDPEAFWQWTLNAQVITRNGDERPDMWPNRRRTFLLSGVHVVKPCPS